MQTKNVNVNQAPLNNSVQEKSFHDAAGRSNVTSLQQTTSSNSDTPLGFAATSPAPPLPPRGLLASSVVQPPGSSNTSTVQGKTFISGESCVIPR
ncbi:hypothetical protein L798_15144 [Zootermopsis nevadensis]|uniref:Uncharacterized protein n=1 Tax=Zootermopsis nevadensis TaxID=136037 RepID=A0A067QZQ5_ZOONE|nr:hypothetical protein L798_15144 [Zootermopsis nevadensis]